jgi:hypothetical protein
MIIAMIAMRMMKAFIDEIVDVVAMRNCLVAATWAMPMSCFMSACLVLRRATIGVPVVHFENVFVSMAILHMMQMTMIEIVNVVPMLNGCMTTARAMDVRTLVSRLIGGGHRLAFPTVRYPHLSGTQKAWAVPAPMADNSNVVAVTSPVLGPSGKVGRRAAITCVEVAAAAGSLRSGGACRIRVIRDRVEPTAGPAMSALPRKRPTIVWDRSSRRARADSCTAANSIFIRSPCPRWRAARLELQDRAPSRSSC